MLRLSNLLRSKALQRKIPIRGGAPGWDRPDPPPSATVPYDKQLTDEQIIYQFPDRNMPEYILTQPEIYEGDTLLQATPMLLKGLGLFLGVAATLSFVGFIMNPGRKILAPEPSQLATYNTRKELVQSRKLLKLASQNPLGIKLTNDSFPRHKIDCGNFEGKRLQNIKIRNDENQKVIGQVRSYLISVKEKATKKVQERLAKQNSTHHSDGHSDSHSQHHSKGAHNNQEAHKEGHEKHEKKHH